METFSAKNTKLVFRTDNKMQILKISAQLYWANPSQNIFSQSKNKKSFRENDLELTVTEILKITL